MLAFQAEYRYNIIEMGNDQNHHSTDLSLTDLNIEDWAKLEDQGYCQLWLNKRNHRRYQAYHIADQNARDKEQLEKYAFRKTHNSHIVSVEAVVARNQTYLCSQPPASYVLIQNITSRLRDWPKSLSFEQALYVLSGASVGYNTLNSFFGPLEPNEDLVCFNEQGKVKVWLNENLSKNEPSLNARTGEFDRIQTQDSSVARRRTKECVLRLIRLVEVSSIQPFPIKFREQISNLSTFFEVANYVDYYSEGNGIKIADRIIKNTNQVRNNQPQFSKSYASSIPAQAQPQRLHYSRVNQVIQSNFVRQNNIIIPISPVHPNIVQTGVPIIRTVQSQKILPQLPQPRITFQIRPSFQSNMQQCQASNQTLHTRQPANIQQTSTQTLLASISQTETANKITSNAEIPIEQNSQKESIKQRQDTAEVVQQQRQQNKQVEEIPQKQQNSEVISHSSSQQHISDHQFAHQQQDDLQHSNQHQPDHQDHMGHEQQQDDRYYRADPNAHTTEQLQSAHYLQDHQEAGYSQKYYQNQPQNHQPQKEQFSSSLYSNIEQYHPRQELHVSPVKPNTEIDEWEAKLNIFATSQNKQAHFQQLQSPIKEVSNQQHQSFRNLPVQDPEENINQLAELDHSDIEKYIRTKYQQYLSEPEASESSARPYCSIQKYTGSSSSNYEHKYDYKPKQDYGKYEYANDESRPYGSYDKQTLDYKIEGKQKQNYEPAAYRNYQQTNNRISIQNNFQNYLSKRSSYQTQPYEDYAQERDYVPVRRDSDKHKNKTRNSKIDEKYNKYVLNSQKTKLPTFKGTNSRDVSVILAADDSKVTRISPFPAFGKTDQFASRKEQTYNRKEFSNSSKVETGITYAKLKNLLWDE